MIAGIKAKTLISVIFLVILPLVSVPSSGVPLSKLLDFFSAIKGSAGRQVAEETTDSAQTAVVKEAADSSGAEVAKEAAGKSELNLPENWRVKEIDENSQISKAVVGTATILSASEVEGISGGFVPPDPCESELYIYAKEGDLLFFKPSKDSTEIYSVVSSGITLCVISQLPNGWVETVLGWLAYQK